MSRRKLIPLGSLLAAVALCLALVLTTSANGSPASVTQFHKVPGVRHGSALNWSGYAVETNLTTPASQVVSDVQGSWTVPAVTGTRSRAYSSIWVGIDGYSDSTVEQIGTEQDWTGRSGSYYAWYEMYPAGMHTIGRVYAGDTMTGEVSSPSAGHYLLTISDTTPSHHFTFSTTQVNTSALNQSAEWIAEAPSSYFGVLPLANFGTMAFTGAQATLGGHQGSISDTTWQNDPITMVTSRGVVKAAPSGLLLGGSSFTVTWHHS